MPTNNKEYMKGYNKKYYKEYYQNNKNNINSSNYLPHRLELQKEYYQNNKNNINSSYYLPHRLELQRKYYKEKIGREPRKYNKNRDIKKIFKLNYGSFIIIFE
jgi:hypothetical protein